MNQLINQMSRTKEIKHFFLHRLTHIHLGCYISFFSKKKRVVRFLRTEERKFPSYLLAVAHPQLRGTILLKLQVTGHNSSVIWVSTILNLTKSRKSPGAAHRQSLEPIRFSIISHSTQACVRGG